MVWQYTKHANTKVYLLILMMILLEFYQYYDLAEGDHS